MFHQKMKQKRNSNEKLWQIMRSQINLHQFQHKELVLQNNFKEKPKILNWHYAQNFSNPFIANQKQVQIFEWMKFLIKTRENTHKKQ